MNHIGPFHLVAHNISRALNRPPSNRIVDIPDIPMLPTNSFYNISDLNGKTSSGPDKTLTEREREINDLNIYSFPIQIQTQKKQTETEKIVAKVNKISPSISNSACRTRGFHLVNL